mmetsp:Transcript_2896/g.10330  ORF Transcript_2896/g.10330 Transcript_2896/m.10330 type:complete len:343 (-) Transcript_2896:1746-2774(-)
MPAFTCGERAATTTPTRGHIRKDWSLGAQPRRPSRAPSLQSRARPAATRRPPKCACLSSLTRLTTLQACSPSLQSRHHQLRASYEAGRCWRPPLEASTTKSLSRVPTASWHQTGRLCGHSRWSTAPGSRCGRFRAPRGSNSRASWPMTTSSSWAARARVSSVARATASSTPSALPPLRPFADVWTSHSLILTFWRSSSPTTRVLTFLRPATSRLATSTATACLTGATGLRFAYFRQRTTQTATACANRTTTAQPLRMQTRPTRTATVLATRVSLTSTATAWCRTTTTARSTPILARKTRMRTVLGMRVTSASGTRRIAATAAATWTVTQYVTTMTCVRVRTT